MSGDAPKPSERQTAPSPETPEGNGRPETTVTPAQPPPPPAGQLFYEYRLPERIPDAWVRDLKNAVKENRTKLIITTVLSSSLLTSVLTTVGKYYLDKRQEIARAEREIEMEGR